MSHVLLGAIGVLADGAPHNTGPDFGKASPFGLLVIVLLLIAAAFLVRSMNRQLRKVPKSFDTDKVAPDQAADEVAEKPSDKPSDNPTARRAPGPSPGTGAPGDDRDGSAHAPDS